MTPKIGQSSDQFDVRLIFTNNDWPKRKIYRTLIFDEKLQLLLANFKRATYWSFFRQGLIKGLTWTILGTFPTFTESIEEIVSSQLVAIVWQFKKLKLIRVKQSLHNHKKQTTWLNAKLVQRLKRKSTYERNHVTNDRKNISQQLTLRKLYNNWE